MFFANIDIKEVCLPEFQKFRQVDTQSVGAISLINLGVQSYPRGMISLYVELLENKLYNKLTGNISNALSICVLYVTYTYVCIADIAAAHWMQRARDCWSLPWPAIWSPATPV